MIITKSAVRAAYCRSLMLDPARDHDAAIAAAAQSLGIPDEAVRGVVETCEEETA